MEKKLEDPFLVYEFSVLAAEGEVRVPFEAYVPFVPEGHLDFSGDLPVVFELTLTQVDGSTFASRWVRESFRSSIPVGP